MDETGDDRPLVRAAQTGDTAAFETLVRRHQRLIDALAYRMTGTQGDQT